MHRRNFLESSLSVMGAAYALGLMPTEALSAGISPDLAGEPSTGYEALRNAFQNPPQQNQNWTRWWWFGPQASEEGISYELEQMKKQGLAGVEINWMCPLEPDG